jgi:hypothetical protein
MEVQNNMNIDEALMKLEKLQKRIDKQKQASKNWKLQNLQKTAEYQKKKYNEKYKEEYKNNPVKKAKHLEACKKYYANKKIKQAQQLLNVE